jgi:hypothetical protein
MRTLEWRKIYDEVQKKGLILKNSYPTLDKNKKMVSPVAYLSTDAQKALDKEIKELLKRCTTFLNFIGNKPSEPLWIYSEDDPTTWLSHPSFAYGHLLRL